MEDKIYTCECGRTFTKPNAFNGHKSHCKVHMEACGKLDKLISDELNRHQLAKIVIDENKKSYQNQKQLELIENLKQWVSEQHICEKCGKVMTEKYGSGRFCCKSCSRKHVRSEESKQKTRDSILSHLKPKLEEKNLKRRFCLDCGEDITDISKKAKRCPDCRKRHYKESASISLKNAVKRKGGNLNPYGVRGTAKYGTYKGFHCDSSWELAFVVYCLDNGIDIQRNHLGFKYIYKGEEHIYYPDFIVNGVLTEIKNYYTELVQVKIDCIPPSIEYKILYYKDVKPYIDYVSKKYGKNFCNILYDKNEPSFMDREKIHGT